MASKRPTTTIKISRKLMRHIEAQAYIGESIDETLKRLLKLTAETAAPLPVPPPLTTTIKVSRMVMNFIQKQCKKERSGKKESRDETLSRLLCVERDNGNIKGA